jgi:dihydropteroate synthase
MKPEVAAAALEAGATFVNDVGGKCAPVAATQGAGLVVMHRQGTPQDMQRDPQYGEVVREVLGTLDAQAAAARAAGVQEIFVDPGIGFGKTKAHNLALLHALPRLLERGTPVLVGTSRKSFLGRIVEGAPELSADERLEGSLASASWAMACGAAIIRVHDVAATLAAARLFGAAIDAESGELERSVA